MKASIEKRAGKSGTAAPKRALRPIPPGDSIRLFLRLREGAAGIGRAGNARNDGVRGPRLS